MDDIEVLRSLVEVYSPSGREAGAVERFLGYARALGLVAESDGAGNGIARIGIGPPRLVFLGHIDTVEGELPVRVEDGRLWGRGACDAKGALAAALLAASRHHGPDQIVVIAAVGEELDSRGARFLLGRHRPDFLIVGEPSGWDRITIGYKGNLSLLLRLEGDRAHLSAPTATTVEAGLAMIDHLRRACIEHVGATPFHSLTFKVHSFNTTRSGSREQVEIGVNLRLPPGLDHRAVLRLVREATEPATCDVIDASDAVAVNPRNEVVRALGAGVRRNGGRPTLLRKLGTSDLNLAAPAWRCPAAAYGPGNSHLDHTDGEHLELADYRRSIDILQTAFLRLTDRHTPAVVRSAFDIA